MCIVPYLWEQNSRPGDLIRQSVAVSSAGISFWEGLFQKRTAANFRNCKEKRMSGEQMGGEI
jgi:hypothetical protein